MLCYLHWRTQLIGFLACQHFTAVFPGVHRHLYRGSLVFDLGSVIPSTRTGTPVMVIVQLLRQGRAPSQLGSSMGAVQCATGCKVDMAREAGPDADPEPLYGAMLCPHRHWPATAATQDTRAPAIVTFRLSATAGSPTKRRNGAG
eukprot:scaffold2627_cov421-Prasinococcus_capsulatus_cf.AAC.5